MPSHKGHSISVISVSKAYLLGDFFGYLKEFTALLSSLGYPLLDKGSSIPDTIQD
jgi:hypothetical protein